MNEQTLINGYESLALIMGQMLHSAKQQHWDQLTDLESFYLDKLEQLKQLEAAIHLSAATKARKLSIIHRILADDREVKDLSNPWMNKLSCMMHGASVEARLSRSYGM